ncbi:outer membrane protein [Erythrobacter mangrovi]|uniref:Porin family protein n=1 Tax=Erythrobacter mangrovi TaxID=2739433 RepID=A0A7D4CNU5_9SPHN|nr:porin family protein [Erythrobacter mangrovi]QKG72328.1 porin family protein [Erythrobacter mangrovi]
MTTRLGALFIASIAFASFATPAMAEEFEGPFVGVAAGYNRDEIDFELNDGVGLPDEFSQDSAYFQLFAGYDFAVAPRVRLGVEAAIGVGADDQFGLSDSTASIDLDPDYTYEATGRIGYLVSENAMVFARGGYQVNRVEVALAEAGNSPFTGTGDIDGWLVGGGVEYAFGSKLRSRIEYRYSDLKNGGVSWDRHQVLAGVLWNF